MLTTTRQHHPFSLVAASLAARPRTVIFLAMLACWLLGGANGMTTAGGAEPRVDALTKTPRGHAHNDYLHPNPLTDALTLGFASIEADVFLVGDDLLVAHTRREIQPGATLRKLYLEPLLRHVREQAGQADPNRQASLILLVDIKSEAEATYRVLHEQLAEYAEILSRWEAGRWHTGPVTVVVSGNRPQQTIGEQPLRYVGIDGRLSDVGDGRPAHLVPMISDRWGSHFTWHGAGPMPADQRQRLKEIVEQTKSAGQQLRFWATPESESFWTELADSGVDLIGTDQLAKLASFLQTRQN